MSGKKKKTTSQGDYGDRGNTRFIPLIGRIIKSRPPTYMKDSGREKRYLTEKPDEGKEKGYWGARGDFRDGAFPSAMIMVDIGNRFL